MMTSNQLAQWNHNWFGVWREVGYFAQCPSVEDCIDLSQRWPDEQELLKYLRNAPVIEAYGAKFKCKLCDAFLPVGIQSDGVLAWPLNLGHYISTHGVVLPTRFVRHIRTAGYLAPRSCGVLRENLEWPSPFGDSKDQQSNA